MIYGSVCSGIEAASVAWHSLGWRASFLSEIDAFPRAVLKHHYPDVPLHGDFTTIKAGQYEPIDVLVGGTPCQSFSVAGLRGGLADERGNLALEYLRLAERLRPRWLVWENVPGVLSATSHDAPDPRSPPDDMAEGSEWVGEDEYDADENHAFSCFLAGLSEIGYGFAYRSFDAQYFGLAQRRERVFVVGYLGDWRRAAAVLFEPESLRGNPPPRRETRERVAPTIAARTRGGGGLGTDFDCDGGLIAHPLRAQSQPSRRADSDTYVPVAFGGNNTAGAIDVATAVNAHGGPHGRLDFESETFVTHSLRAEGHDASEGGTGRGVPLVPVAYRTSPNFGAWETGDRTDALTTGTDPNSHVLTLAIRGRGDSHDLEWRDDGTANAVLTPNGGRAGIGVGAIATFQQNSMQGRGTLGYDADTQVLRPVKPQADHQMLQMGSAVRRLTPRECARLQGFPDDYLDISYRGKPAADGNKYKALGNSMAVPVMRWIGRRIQAADKA